MSARLLLGVLLGAVAVGGCSGQKRVGEPCSYDVVNNASDCESPLYCNHQDGCTSPCAGLCKKPCVYPSDCPGRCTCSLKTSSAQGSKDLCQGPDC